MIDWGSEVTLLQALCVSVCVILFVMGYRAGDRV